MIDLMCRRVYKSSDSPSRAAHGMTQIFFKENDKWYEVNAIKKKTSINEIREGQDVIIVIGENLNADIVGNYIGKHD